MMANQTVNQKSAGFVLTDDERAIVVFLRTLQIDREEAMRRLAISQPLPCVPGAPELQANLPAVSKDPLTNENET
jgi:hypothetical protein